MSLKSYTKKRQQSSVTSIISCFNHGGKCSLPGCLLVLLVHEFDFPQKMISITRLINRVSCMPQVTSLRTNVLCVPMCRQANVLCAKTCNVLFNRKEHMFSSYEALLIKLISTFIFSKLILVFPFLFTYFFSILIHFILNSCYCTIYQCLVFIYSLLSPRIH